MKKIIKPYQNEEAKYFCDKHPDREAYFQVENIAWYGSQFDCMNVQVHMCDECSAQFFKYVKDEFGVEPTEGPMY